MKYLKITSKKNHHILSEWEAVSNFEFDKKILNSGELVLKPEKVDNLLHISGSQHEKLNYDINC